MPWRGGDAAAEDGSFSHERTRELTSAQMRRLREVFNRKIGVEISPCKGEGGLNSVGFRLELEQGRELRLSASTPMMDHRLLRDRPSDIRANIPFEHGKNEVVAAMPADHDADLIGL